MRSYASIIPFLLRLAGYLTTLGLILIGLAAVVGSTLPATTILLRLSDPPIIFLESGQLHLMDARLGLTAKIADTPSACCAVWSPDGRHIAFRGEIGQPMILDMRDSTLHVLGEPDVNMSAMSWSPDSQEIVFSVSNSASGKYTLYRANADGSELTQVASLLDTDFYGDIYQADWSPDGRYIVFAARGGTLYRLYRVNADGTKLRQLKTKNPFNLAPSVSPDGQTIAYISGETDATDLFLMDISGNNIRQLTFSDDNEKMAIWSPDGSRILLVTAINNDSSRVIDIINADGSGQRRLFDTSTSFAAVPSWSPDGTQILFEVQYYAVSANGRGVGLYIMDADGSNQRLLLEDNLAFTLEAAWQPQP